MAEGSTKLLKSINEADWLSKPHVHMKDSEQVIEKINNIIQGGSKQLQVVFDFDRTLTKHHENGVITHSSYGVLETAPTFPKNFAEASRANLAKYRPIEINPNISMEEKIPIMVEWWTNGIEAMKGIQWDLDIIEKHLRDNQQPLRLAEGVLRSMPTIPKEYSEASKAILTKYLPIETDPKLSMEEKLPHMIEWWTAEFEMMKGIQWDLRDIDKHIRENQQPFRDGTKACFEQLQNAGVPVLVFSAGLGDVVRIALTHGGLLTSNVHIISNFLKIEDGKITGYIGENLIHVFNKNELHIKNTPYYEELSGRTNVILLGDSTGDAMMADGVSHNNVLKIGFLNTEIEESLTQFKDLFDIVLTDDQTMDVLNHILKFVL